MPRQSKGRNEQYLPFFFLGRIERKGTLQELFRKGGMLSCISRKKICQCLPIALRIMFL